MPPGSDGPWLALAFEWRAEQISRHQQFLSTTAAIIQRLQCPPMHESFFNSTKKGRREFILLDFKGEH